MVVGILLIKDGAYYDVMVDRDRRAVETALSKRRYENLNGWVTEFGLAVYDVATRRFSRLGSSLSKRSTTAASKVRRDTYFTEILSSAINYGRTFDKKFKNPFADSRIRDIADDMKNSNYIRNDSRATYARYEHIEKLLVLHSNLLPHLKELRKGKAMHICIGLTHLDDATLHDADKDTSLYLNKDADAFIKSKDNKISFHVPNLYKYGNDLLRELWGLNNDCPAAQKESFLDFM